MQNTTSNTAAARERNISSILVYLEEDDLDYSPVAAAACHLAGHLKADLWLINAAYDERSEAVEFLNRTECDAMKAKCLAEHTVWLDRARHDFHCSGVSIHSEVVWEKHSHRAIVKKVIDLGADLVIKHVPSNTSSMSARLSSLDRNILHFVPAPVLLVKKPFPGLYARVLGAIDPLTGEKQHEALNRDIVDWSGKLVAAEKEAEFYSVSAYPNMNLSYMLEAGSNERDWRGEMEDYCQQRLNALFEERSVIPTSRHIREGHCDRVIIDVADELHANLLVLGSVARSGLSSLFVGNTVEKILDKVDCDILCLKPSTYVGKLRQHMLEELKQA